MTTQRGNSIKTSIKTNGTSDGARVRVAIAGATGFAGQELIRLLARHPRVSITAATAIRPNSAACSGSLT